MSKSANLCDELKADATNILLLSSPMDPTTDHACTRLLDGDSGPPDRSLWITYTRSPDKKLGLLRRDSAAASPTQGVIVVGGQPQSITQGGSAVPTRPTSPVIRSVTEPTDLTELGIELSKFFVVWGAEDGQFSICFDSITPMLVYASVDRAYRFLQTLTSQIDALGATAHYHFDPSAHSAQTARRLIRLFDNVVDCTGNEGLPRSVP